MTFPLELDHVVVFSAVDAPEARAVEGAGFLGYGGTTQHGPVGSSSTSFFVDNAYLELFWLHDEAAAAQAHAPTGDDITARMRWRSTGASPFGVLVRRRAGVADPIPFPTTRLVFNGTPFEHAPAFARAVLHEPFVGVLPEDLTYPAWKANIPVQSHPLGIEILTQVRITVPADHLSPVAQLLTENGLVTFVPGASHLMELVFDHGRKGKRVEIRPTLPLVLLY
ncbi:MAG: hypothetical protein U0768_08340 [Anaerolineae bacterium]